VSEPTFRPDRLVAAGEANDASGQRNGSTPLFKRVAWKLALVCWTLRLDRLGNYFEDVRWS